MKKKTITIGALLLAMNCFSQTDTLAYRIVGKEKYEFDYYNKELKDFDVPTDGSLIVVKELPEEIKTWAQKSENGYEVSSKGDKRFSAFYAKLKNGKSVILLYITDL